MHRSTGGILDVHAHMCSGPVTEMPSNKSHHFVPRVHFRPFSADGRGRAVNLINIGRELAIPNASVSGQCAKAYFYGNTPEIENGLAYFEGRYAQIVRVLEARGALSDDDRYALRTFVLFQLMRTEAFAARAMAVVAGGHDLMFVGDWAEHRPDEPTERAAVLMGLSSALRCTALTGDLQMSVLLNRTGTDFITSDNPAIACNKWAWQRHRHHRFGMISSGLIMVLPLTPRMALCYFDAGVYRYDGGGDPFRILTRRGDVDWMNELQILNADQNVYFTNWATRLALLDQIQAVKDRRPERRVEFDVFVEDADGQDALLDGQRYRRATEAEIASPLPKVVGHHQVYPVPHGWLSGLIYRLRPTAFRSRSALGWVRRREWLTQRGREQFRI